jgi:hypothetical protein
VGQTFVLDGIPFRLARGSKGPTDIRLEWCGATGLWRAPGYRVLGVLADTLGENEAALYPNGQGADYLVSYLYDAAHNGWQSAERGWNDRG